MLACIIIECNNNKKKAFSGWPVWIEFDSSWHVGNPFHKRPYNLLAHLRRCFEAWGHLYSYRPFIILSSHLTVVHPSIFLGVVVTIKNYWETRFLLDYVLLLLPICVSNKKKRAIFQYTIGKNLAHFLKWYSQINIFKYILTAESFCRSF